ncbi:MFS transporter [Spirochaetia bacterium]|nr:MFS transporter [Spirochaetia bacterium]
METAAKKRPFGFYVCSATFTFERLSYYASKWLIAIFVAASVVSGGLGLTQADGGKMQANLVAFTYLAPILGGLLSDRIIGARYCIPIGTFLMGLGYVCGYFSQSIGMVWVMIILVSIGTGLFKGNISAINGRLFQNKEDLDSAFSIQYSFVNIGAFFGTFLVGILALKTFACGEVMGYRICFLLAGIAMFAGTIWYLLGMKHLGDVGKRPFKFDEKLGDDLKKVEKTYEKKPLTGIEKKRVAAIILVSVFSVVFWLFWYLAYLPVYYYWEDNMNWLVGSFTVPSSWFDSLNGFACIALGPILAILWAKLAKRPQGDMSMFKKTAWGLSFMAAAYLIFALADATRGSGKAGLMYLVVFGLLLSLGEMFFSPLGFSFVSKYAPAKLLSVMMGVWIVATFLAAKSYGYIYAFMSTKNFIAGNVVVAIICIVCALVLFALNKKLKGLVEEGKE